MDETENNETEQIKLPKLDNIKNIKNINGINKYKSYEMIQNHKRKIQIEMSEQLQKELISRLKNLRGETHIKKKEKNEIFDKIAIVPWSEIVAINREKMQNIVKEIKQNDLEKKEEDKNEIEIIDLNKNNKKPLKHIYQIKDTYTKNTTLKSSDTIYYIHTTPLQTLNFTPQKMLSLCDEIIKYFKIYIPKVISGGPKLVLSKYSPSYFNKPSS